MKNKIKTSAVVGAIGVLLAASGITGYKLVKTKNYGAMEKNLHEVVRVIDGDTFEVEGSKKGDVVTVRILNVSAPEKGECYYSQSKKALEELISGKKVKLTKDVSGVDEYDRLLRHVVLPSGTEKEDDVMVGKYLIENGFARAMPIFPDVEFKEYFARFDSLAEKNDVGTWKDCEGKLPKSFTSVDDADPEDVDCLIKGNISSIDKEKRYFLPNCPSYSQVKIDLKKGEAYFCSEEEAEKAGFMMSESCANVFK